MGTYDTLQAVRDHLGALPGVTTSRIGLESNMTPADYPIIRIVPGRLSNGPTMARRNIEALVYFGQPIHEFTGEPASPDTTGLEELYAGLLAMEAEIISALRTLPGGVSCVYRDTILDEDRTDAYKLMCLRVEISG